MKSEQAKVNKHIQCMNLKCSNGSWPALEEKPQVVVVYYLYLQISTVLSAVSSLTTRGRNSSKQTLKPKLVHESKHYFKQAALYNMARI